LPGTNFWKTKGEGKGPNGLQQEVKKAGMSQISTPNKNNGGSPKGERPAVHSPNEGGQTIREEKHTRGAAEGGNLNSLGGARSGIGHGRANGPTNSEPGKRGTNKRQKKGRHSQKGG